MGPERPTGLEGKGEESAPSEYMTNIPQEILTAIDQINIHNPKHHILQQEFKKALLNYAEAQERQAVLKAAGKDYEAAQAGIEKREIYHEILENLMRVPNIQVTMVIALIDQRREMTENSNSNGD